MFIYIITRQIKWMDGWKSIGAGTGRAGGAIAPQLLPQQNYWGSN